MDKLAKPQRRSAEGTTLPLPVDIFPNVRIDQAIDMLIGFAQAEKQTVVGVFNGKELFAEPGSTYEDVLKQWAANQKMSPERARFVIKVAKEFQVQHAIIQETVNQQ